MATDCCKIVLSLIASIFFVGVTYAQPRAVGTSYSLTGVGVTYEHSTGDFNYLETSVRMELGEMFIGRTEKHGVSASFTWNRTLKEWTSDSGDCIRIFAGAGGSVGLCNDFSNDWGYHIGLKGRGGIECQYKRQICVSACLAPVLGTHLIIDKEHATMSYYRYGLINALIPEISIKYMF